LEIFLGSDYRGAVNEEIKTSLALRMGYSVNAIYYRVGKIGMLRGGQGSDEVFTASFSSNENS
jgi:hypothetical protein